MMGPNDYININSGKRERIALFVEYESQINNKLWLNTGLRVERVNTQVDEVQAYNDGMMNMGSMSAMTTANNALAANNFNNADRDITDTLVDVNVLANYQVTLYDELQLGLARKSRAPNLYERYSWGVSNMASTMIGWYGDANGYIGNPNLKAETAHTISATYSKTAKNDAWRVSANVWYTDVTDYIDADIVRSFNSYGLANTTRNILSFTNVDATLYGAKLDISKSLYQSTQFGEWQLKANITSTRGKRRDTNQPLYQIKPLHTALSLSQQIGVFENALLWHWVDTKSRVDVNRLENQTVSYSLVNISSKATFDALTLGIEVVNLFDTFYQLPLGGVSIAALKQGSSTGFTQLAGQGRSFNISASYAF